jgi:anti-sigma factor RsiW
MNSCQPWIPLLSPFIDGELAPSGRIELERHLAHCEVCRARVGDLRAQSGLVRVGFEMLADEPNFDHFFERVMARVTPERLSLWERWRLSVSELFTYHRTAMVSSLVTATASVALLIGTSLILANTRTPDGYASALWSVRKVTTVPEAHVAPVVMPAEGGNTIVWLVNHRHLLDSAAGEGSRGAATPEGLDSGTSPIDKLPLKQQRPHGGEL